MMTKAPHIQKRGLHMRPLLSRIPGGQNCRQHCQVDSIAASLFVLNWLSRQIVSDDKIQITILILRRGALSIVKISSKYEQKTQIYMSFLWLTQANGRDCGWRQAMSWAHKRTSQPPWGDNVGLSWGLDHCASLIGDGHHWPPSDDDLAIRVQSTHITTINGSYA